MRRKKILFVRTAMGQGGADRVTAILLRSLDKKKYEVSILLMKREGEYLASIPPEVKIYNAKAANLWFFLPSLYSVIRKEAPEIVFSIDGGVNVPLSLLAFLSPFRKWKCILSERNVLFPSRKSILKRGFMVFLKFIFYRFADTLTAVSIGVREDMHRHLKIPIGRIKIVYNPMVEEENIVLSQEPVDHLWFEEKRKVPVIVHAGRFVYQKDHSTLIDAFYKVREQIPCHLFLLGEGPLEPKIRAKVQEYGLQDDVYFHGFDLNPFKFFAKCDVFVLSSLHEGMPGALIQAMACGAPSVSTDCPYGPNEIIDERANNGVLVRVGDSNALASAIIKVLSDTVFAQTLRINGPIAVRKFVKQDAIASYVNAMEE